MAVTPNYNWPVPVATDYVKDGWEAISDLGNAIDTSLFSAVGGIGTWTAYTPTITGMTLGNGTADFKYSEIGKTVFVQGRITFGSTSSMSSNPTFTLPVTATSASVNMNTTNLNFNSNSFMGATEIISTTTVRMYGANVGANQLTKSTIDANTPGTAWWTTGKQMFFQINYEAA